jgi:hypothetical protein
VHKLDIVGKRVESVATYAGNLASDFEPVLLVGLVLQHAFIGRQGDNRSGGFFAQSSWELLVGVNATPSVTLSILLLEVW